MNRGGSRINPSAITASLMGQERGTIALDLYSGGAALDALKAAVADLEDRGLHGEVVQTLGETLDQRPPNGAICAGRCREGCGLGPQEAHLRAPARAIRERNRAVPVERTD